MIHRFSWLCVLGFCLLARTGCGTVLAQASAINPNDLSKQGNLSRQDSSGVITLLARDATTHSVMMRYEPQTNKNCLGYWTNPADWANWDFEVVRPGKFEIEVWQGCGKGQGGSEVAVEVGDKRFDFIVEDTGHFQNFIARKIGVVEFPSAGKFTLAVKPQRKQASAIMDIRQVRLVPVKVKKTACLGAPEIFRLPNGALRKY